MNSTILSKGFSFLKSKPLFISALILEMSERISSLYPGEKMENHLNGILKWAMEIV